MRECLPGRLGAGTSLLRGLRLCRYGGRSFARGARLGLALGLKFAFPLNLAQLLLVLLLDCSDRRNLVTRLTIVVSQLYLGVLGLRLRLHNNDGVFVARRLERRAGCLNLVPSGRRRLFGECQCLPLLKEGGMVTAELTEQSGVNLSDGTHRHHPLDGLTETSRREDLFKCRGPGRLVKDDEMTSICICTGLDRTELVTNLAFKGFGLGFQPDKVNLGFAQLPDNRDDLLVETT